VTPYFKNEPGVFRSLFVELWSDMAEFRLTIDEPADLAYIETVLSLVPSRGTRYSSHAILKVVKQRQDLRELNAHIPRNEGYAHSLNLESGGA
jgi:spore coat polysaccharide biosynthesis protein SpsF (cytidylyltransferase family)